MQTPERRRSTDATAPPEGTPSSHRAPRPRTVARSLRLAPFFAELRALASGMALSDVALATVCCEQWERDGSAAVHRVVGFLTLADALHAEARADYTATEGEAKSLAAHAPHLAQLARLAARATQEAQRLAAEVKP